MSAAITSDAFVAGVIGLFRVGRAVRSVYLQALRNNEITIAVPELEAMTPAAREQAALVMLVEDPKMRRLVAPGGPFHGVLRDPDAIPPRVDETKPGLVHAAIDCVMDEKGWLRPVEVAANGTGVPITLPAAIVLTHKDWEGEQAGPLWAPLGLALAESVLDIATAQPNLFSLNRKAETLLLGLSPSLRTLFAQDWQSRGARFGEEAVKAFFTGALETLAANPDLVTDEATWQPLVEGVLVPLQEQVAEAGGLGFLARERLADFFTGPLAHGVLSQIQAHPELYLKGEMAEGRVLGAIVRATIGDFVAVAPSDFDVRSLVSERGAVSLFAGIADVMQTRPGLIVRGGGDAGEALRSFLQRAGTVLADAPSPLSGGDDLTSDLLAAALDAAGSYAVVRARAQLGEGDWNQVWGEIAADLVEGFVTGLKAGLPETGAAPGVLETLMTRAQAVSLVKIVADAIARNPHMIGRDVNAEVRNIAQGIAAAIAADEQRLLTGEDWRGVFAVAMALAARNPATLFSLAAGPPERQLAVVLIESLLARAALAFQSDTPQPGAVMAGETLRQALEATLAAASETVIAALDEDRRNVNIAALEEFTDLLNGMAAGAGSSHIRLGAGDWLRAFRYFVVHVLQYGPERRVTAQHVDAFLKGLTPQITGGAVG